MLFANFLGIIEENTKFLAIDGPHLAHIDDAYVELKMQDVSSISSNDNYHILDTGSPHYVALQSGLQAIDMNVEGAKIRHTPPFDIEGVNVNFAEKINDDTFSIRTYERGVEGRLCLVVQERQQLLLQCFTPIKLHQNHFLRNTRWGFESSI